MKILQVINNLDVGGAETLLTNYILYNENNKDIQNHVCLLCSDNGFLKEQLIKSNIKVYSLDLKNKYNFICALLKLFKLLKANKYDVVHGHLFPAQYYCAFLSIFFKKTKFFFTEHSNYNRRRSSKIFYLPETISYSKYDKILCISEMTKMELAKWVPNVNDRLEVLYGGIHIRDPYKDATKKYDIILVGSLRSNVKGVDVLIRAISLISDKISKVAILGDGVLKEELIELAIELGVQNKICFLGNKNNVNDFLNESKLFVLPSRWEGFGLAIIEAMSQKIPVIATNVGGIPEIITDGYDGILIEPDDYNKLAKTIIKLLQDNNYANKLAENAFKTVNNKFSLEIFSQNLNKLYGIEK